MRTVSNEQIKAEVAQFWKEQAERKAPKETIKPFVSEEVKQRHLKYVEENVAKGLIPF